MPPTASRSEPAAPRPAQVSALSTALFLYLVVCLAGYATFGSAVSPDILESYPQARPAVACGARHAGASLWRLSFFRRPCSSVLPALEWQ